MIEFVLFYFCSTRQESDDGILNQNHDGEDSSEEDYVNQQPEAMATEANEGNLPSMEEVDDSWSLVYSEVYLFNSMTSLFVYLFIN